MNIIEIYNRYHVDTVNFIKFVKESKLEYRIIPNGGFDIREDLAGAYIEAFNNVESFINDLIKHIRSLNQKKYRDEYGEYFIEGIKNVLEAIEENADIKQIIICDELLQKEIDIKIFLLNRM